MIVLAHKLLHIRRFLEECLYYLENVEHLLDVIRIEDVRPLEARILIKGNDFSVKHRISSCCSHKGPGSGGNFIVSRLNNVKKCLKVLGCASDLVPRHIFLRLPDLHHVIVHSVNWLFLEIIPISVGCKIYSDNFFFLVDAGSPELKEVFNFEVAIPIDVILLKH